MWPIIVAGALFATACAADQETIESKCERLREHVIDLRMEGLPEADRLAHRTAMQQSLGDRFTDECKALSPAQINCGLAAKDISDTTACSGTSVR